MSLNRVILIGRLTRDPEGRTTNTGKTVVNFSIAVDKRIKPPEAGLDRRDRCENRGGIGNIKLKRQRRFRRIERLHRRTQGVGIDVEQRDTPTVGEKALRCRKPDTARRTGDERDFFIALNQDRSSGKT